MRSDTVLDVHRHGHHLVFGAACSQRRAPGFSLVGNPFCGGPEGRRAHLCRPGLKGKLRMVLYDCLLTMESFMTTT